MGGALCIRSLALGFHLRPYRDEPSASRPIRADKHRRGQRVLAWVTSREHCAAAGFFLHLKILNPPPNFASSFLSCKIVYCIFLSMVGAWYSCLFNSFVGG